MAKDPNDDKTVDLTADLNAINAINATIDGVPITDLLEIEDDDLAAFEDALAKRIAWSDAVELVQDALQDWVDAQSDLAGLCDEEDAEAIKRLTSETMKAWARILQG
jgi:ATP-dependent Clp protease ATP-binding subunit ClpA